MNLIAKTLLGAGLLGGYLLSALVQAEPLAEFRSTPNGRTAFLYLHQVASHARCGNCHGAINRDGEHVPTVGEDRHEHPFKVSVEMNNPGLGMNCQSCHQKFNIDAYGTPPGAADDQAMPGFLWHMPPKSMLLPPGLSARKLCEQWLDPQRNTSALVPDRGSRNDLTKFRAEFLDHHAAIDPLIKWAWQPGKGRSPAPGSHAEFVKAMEIWIDAGAPCP